MSGVGKAACICALQCNANACQAGLDEIMLT